MAKPPVKEQCVLVWIARELLPPNPNAPSVWSRIREYWCSDIETFFASQSPIHHHYHLSYDQTILTLKTVIIQDAKVCADHLTLTSLRVTQWKEDTGERSPRVIMNARAGGNVLIERTDDETIGECRDEDGAVRVHVDIQRPPSTWDYISEHMTRSRTAHPWFWENQGFVHLLICLLLFVVTRTWAESRGARDGN